MYLQEKLFKYKVPSEIGFLAKDRQYYWNQFPKLKSLGMGMYETPKKIFFEFFAMDFDENFILIGHDGPSNINVARGKSR